MPRLVLMVPETNESVIRPVVFDITRELFKITGIDPNTRILYPGEGNTASQQGSELGQQPGDPRLGHSNRISLVVQEEFDQDQILQAAVHQPEQQFIWRDDRIETSIKPAYAQTKVRIAIKYRATDKTAAQKWRDELKTRVSMMRTEYLHAVKYHFMIPEEFIVILKELYRMREAVGGYGEDWDKFWKDSLTQRASQLSTLSGARKAWSVAESQMRIVGRFDFEGVPERGDKTDEGDSWTIEVNYDFQFDKPLACVMSYPLVVHNQVVARNFRPSKADQIERPEIHQRSYSLSSRAYSIFEQGRWTSDKLDASTPGRQVPEFDEFLPVAIPSRTLRVFTALVTVDTAQGGDPSFLLDLNELSDKWSLDPAVLAFMRSTHERLVAPTRSPFLLSFYENRNLLAGDILRVDSDLKVYATKPLPLRSYYHLRLGLFTDWRSMPREMLDLLREDASLLLKLLTAIDSRAVLARVLSTGYVPRAVLEEAIDFLDRAELAQGNQQIYQFNRVGSLFVSANRKE